MSSPRNGVCKMRLFTTKAFIRNEEKVAKKTTGFYSHENFTITMQASYFSDLFQDAAG